MANVERDYVLELYRYHHWATDRVLGAFREITPEQLDEKWGGSFASGRALLRHVVGVERLWYDRWNGSSPKSLPDFLPTFAGKDFALEWSKVKTDQQHYLEGLSRNKIGGELTYVNIKGEKLTYELSDVLVHVVNHGTYHRGQLTHLLRDLGLSATSTDYLLYVEERRKERH